MRSPVGWLGAMLALSIIAFGVTIMSAYPRYIKTIPAAAVWALWDSAVFLLAAAICGVLVVRRSRINTPVLILLVILLGVGAIWSFIYLVAQGL